MSTQHVQTRDDVRANVRVGLNALVAERDRANATAESADVFSFPRPPIEPAESVAETPGGGKHRPDDDRQPRADKKESQATAIVRLATYAGAELFHTAASDSYITIVGAQLVAAIGENAHLDGIGDRFVDSSYAARAGGESQLRAYIATTLDQMQSEPPLAAAASPLRLTLLGEAVNRTGLSPETARRLIGILRTFDEQQTMEIAGAELLRQFAVVPEQNNELLRKIVSQPKSRMPVKPDDFEMVIAASAARAPLMSSFARLPAVRRAKKQVPFELWSVGEVPSPTWDQDFDRYIEFVNAAIDNFLPWLFRASAILSAAMGVRAQFLDWHRWTVALLERTTPETRLDDLEAAEG